MMVSPKSQYKENMSDVIVLIVSGLVGIATLIVSKWRCRYVTTYDANGLETHVSACGFTDQVLVPEKVIEQVEVRPGTVLVVKK
jgi:hypothetical protein